MLNLTFETRIQSRKKFNNTKDDDRFRMGIQNTETERGIATQNCYTKFE